MLEDLTLKKAVEFAVKTEELGGEFYRRLAKKFSDNKVVHDIFSILAREEDGHKAAFAALLDKVEDDKMSSTPERQQYLRAMSISAFFAGEQGLLGQLDAVKTREDALAKALELEKATLGYYQAMGEVMEPNEVLDSIIASEKKHVTGLLKYLITDAKVRGVPEEVDEADFR